MKKRRQLIGRRAYKEGRNLTYNSDEKKEEEEPSLDKVEASNSPCKGRRRGLKRDSELEGSARLFCNRIQIKALGYNQNRLISLLIREGISMHFIKKSSQKEMDIVIDAKNRQKAFAIMQELCYDYKVVAVFGLKPLSQWMLARIGLIIGAVIFFIIAALSTSFIWKIEISGNERVDSLTISRRLDSLNVKIGRLKSIDSFEISQAIIRLDGIVECTVEVVGTTVRVKIIEEKEFLPHTQEDGIGDIVSLYDAEVTRLIVTEGTGMVKIGDRIPAGRVLISKDVFDSNDILAGETRAKGIVYGKVIFSDSSIINTSNEILVKTGRTTKSTTLSIFNINLGGGKTPKFSSYQSVKKQSYPFLNTLLPLRLKQVTYYEVERRVEKREIDELIEEYKKDKLLNLIINAGGSEISTIITKEELSEGVFRVNLYMEAELPIGCFLETIAV